MNECMYVYVKRAGQRPSARPSPCSAIRLGPLGVCVSLYVPPLLPLVGSQDGIPWPLTRVPSVELCATFASSLPAWSRSRFELTVVHIAASVRLRQDATGRRALASPEDHVGGWLSGETARRARRAGARGEAREANAATRERGNAGRAHRARGRGRGVRRAHMGVAVAVECRKKNFSAAVVRFLSFPRR